MIKQAAKSNTMRFNAIVATLGFIQVNLPQVQEQLGEYYGWILIGVGAVGMYLRTITTKPLSEK